MPDGKLRRFDGPQANDTVATSINDKSAVAGYYATFDSIHGFIRMP